MYTILFQGDSLTDACREKKSGNIDSNRYLGNGYVYLAASYLMSKNPDIKAINRGINGNRIIDLSARWEEDTLKQSFNLLSILCGVNDVGFQIRLNQGVDTKKYRTIYDRLLDETRETHPDARIVLCEPFIFKMDPVKAPQARDICENWELWHSEISSRAEVVDELANKYQCLLIESKKLFDKACRRVPGNHWSIDGIHLTPAGNALLAQEWVENVVGAGYVPIS